ncbi:hypothetical protein BV22DRAFT_433744 [Leucogyrophana mollusca]|uniref:Uncharacterized protein n=1 Tax=Leucogyrophana mollusca TaxID=85980 RepID=A0ACB8BIA8_9AGAM|nr:hypothetical protein BV22DRAFT_433744 [Leucogyrophana mollusca]
MILSSSSGGFQRQQTTLPSSWLEAPYCPVITIQVSYEPLSAAFFLLGPNTDSVTTVDYLSEHTIPLSRYQAPGIGCSYQCVGFRTNHKKCFGRDRQVPSPLSVCWVVRAVVYRLIVTAIPKIQESSETSYQMSSGGPGRVIEFQRQRTTRPSSWFEAPYCPVITTQVSYDPPQLISSRLTSTSIVLCR